jgi:16S rRNA (cytidine1402-2'-O)-methyltransferase
MNGILYVVATPIGNLSDITFRAIEILKSVDLIACEDTRQTIKILNRYEIKKPLVSYHQHSKLTKIDYLISELLSGKNIALTTDAGTPGISDPGQVLINQAIESNIDVIPIPGAQAAVTALSASGFNTDKFLYLGFLPKKKGRQTLLTNLAADKFSKTIVIYESPYRIIRTLNDLKNYLGDVQVAVFRELTKKFETKYFGKISEVILNIKPKGEFVIIVNKDSK